MKNILKNIILIVALAAVIVIVIAIMLYDYIPTSSAVAEPKIYSADTETTKVLSEIAEESPSLNSSSGSSSNTTQSSVVLRSYSITETDLALYAASKEYDRGKADPFADPQTSSDSGDGTGSSEGGSTSSGTTGNTSSSNSGSSAISDGTLFNSTSSK